MLRALGLPKEDKSMSNKLKAELIMDQVVPSTDILEKDNSFHIIMDLPGVTKEDLYIDAHGDRITVTAKSSYTPVGPCLHKEHQAVEYSRVFTISDTVDCEKIDATLKNGVLDLRLPKVEVAKPRRIEIKTF
jgi:HSP20 family molecular chaperone IbpA